MMNNPRVSNIIDKLKTGVINEKAVKDKKVLNNLCDDFYKYLNKNRCNFEDLGVDRGNLIVSISGDWKHDHIYFKQLASKFFSDRGYKVTINQNVTNDDGSDYFSADYWIYLDESAIKEDALETLDNVQAANEPTYNVLDDVQRMISPANYGKVQILLKKFSNTPLEDINFIEGYVPDMNLVESKLIIFFLNDGLSTDEENRGVVFVLMTPNSQTHLLDTEIFESGYYKNTVLYNKFELSNLSKKVWTGSVQLKESSKDWRY